MAKKKEDTMLKSLARLRLLDDQLAQTARGVGVGLKIGEFAKFNGVSEKTVRRDLKLLEELGLRIISEHILDEEPIVWRYASGQQPLFSATKPAPVKGRGQLHYTRKWEEWAAVRDRARRKRKLRAPARKPALFVRGRRR